MLIFTKKQLSNVSIVPKYHFQDDKLYLVIFIKKYGKGYADFKDFSLKKQLLFCKLISKAGEATLPQNIISYILTHLHFFPNLFPFYHRLNVDKINKLECFIDSNFCKYITSNGINSNYPVGCGSNRSSGPLGCEEGITHCANGKRRRLLVLE